MHLAGATPVRFAQTAARGFLPDPAEIARLVTPRTKALLINTPGNPTGAVFSAALMADISEVVRSSGIYLVSDEIYEDIVFEGEHVSAAKFTPADRLFVVSGFSKTYAMTGWRIGWLVCPPGLAADRRRAARAGDELRLDHRAEGGRGGACGRPAIAPGISATCSSAGAISSSTCSAIRAAAGRAGRGVLRADRYRLDRPPLARICQGSAGRLRHGGRARDHIRSERRPLRPRSLHDSRR